eukprot:70178-Chlamydomonas_euryale.AAC.1
MVHGAAGCMKHVHGAASCMVHGAAGCMVHVHGAAGCMRHVHGAWRGGLHGASCIVWPVHGTACMVHGVHGVQCAWSAAGRAAAPQQRLHTCGIACLTAASSKYRSSTSSPSVCVNAHPAASVARQHMWPVLGVAAMLTRMLPMAW